MKKQNKKIIYSKKSKKRRNFKNNDNFDDDEDLENYKDTPIQKEKVNNKKFIFNEFFNYDKKEENSGVESKTTKASSSINENTNELLENNIELLNLNDDDNENEYFFLSHKTRSILSKIYNKNKNNNKDNNISNNDINNTIVESSNEKISDDKSNILFIEEKKNSPILSPKTMDIIKKIKQNRKQNTQTDDNNETIKDNIFTTLSFKYKDLIQKTRDIILPVKYKVLHELFLCLERIINLNKVTYIKTNNSFYNIQNYIQNVSKHNFNIEILEQIIYLVPHFYIMKYEKNKDNDTFKLNAKINKNYDLIIDIPYNYKELQEKEYPPDFNFLSINFFKENETASFNPVENQMPKNDLDERSNIFKNILINYTNKYHKLFLERNKINILFDPLIEKTWHHKFDLDKECPDIPKFKIPEPPININCFEQFINKNDLKGQLYTEFNIINNESINNRDSEKIETKQKENDPIITGKITDNNKSNVNKYLSNAFIEKIKAKEKCNKIINNIQTFIHEHNEQKDVALMVSYVLTQIKIKLLMNNNSSIKINDLSENLINCNSLIKKYINSIETMNSFIEYLSAKFTNFISVKNNSLLGPVVVLNNKNYNIPDINDIKKIIYSK